MTSKSMYNFFDLEVTDLTAFTRPLSSSFFRVFVKVCCGIFDWVLMSLVQIPCRSKESVHVSYGCTRMYMRWERETERVCVAGKIWGSRKPYLRPSRIFGTPWFAPSSTHRTSAQCLQTATCKLSHEDLWKAVSYWLSTVRWLHLLTVALSIRRWNDLLNLPASSAVDIEYWSNKKYDVLEFKTNTSINWIISNPMIKINGVEYDWFKYRDGKI